MSDNVVAFAANVVAISSARPEASPPNTVAAECTAPAQPPVRLMVTEAPETGYVYQIVDALTGLLIAEIQRQEAGALDPSGYVAGALVSTKA